MSRPGDLGALEDAITTEAGRTSYNERVHVLRHGEPDPDGASAEQVEAFVAATRQALEQLSLLNGRVDASDEIYLRGVAEHQVHNAARRLKGDRQSALDILGGLFRLGSVPAPHGRYDGELVAISTGLLSDPFFEWLTRLYLPWLGKTFDASSQTGDNVFVDNAWSKTTGKLGWPEYRVRSDEPPDTVRVFPFRTYEAGGIEDPGLRVLRIDYSAAPNPLPVRRLVDEIVELPGGYYLGKAHMRGLREFRRVAFFGLLPVPAGPSSHS